MKEREGMCSDEEKLNLLAEKLARSKRSEITKAE